MTKSIGLRGGAAMGLVLLLAGCPDRQAAEDAALEIRGSDPSGVRGGGPAVSADGIVSYDGYQAARAREGETVAELAQRLGLASSELGAYNGLAPTHRLRSGDELVLPPRPGGYSLAPAPSPAPALASAAEAQTLPPLTAAAPEVEATPLAPAGTLDPAAPPEAGDALAAAPLEAAASPAPTESPLPSESGWSPELAAAAIARSSGDEAADAPAPAPAPAAPAAAADPALETETPGTRADLAAPPSAGDPLPANPDPVPELSSPQLSQYQSASPGETVVALAPEAVPAASAPPRLQRPVEGPVALGFREGSGSIRNEGVDFNAPAGAPVVAAEDGEVLLVSQALGGLGTIVLIRHNDGLLTSYGRISDVPLRKGERVRRGQQIGVVAQPDRGVPPRMHFEVRRGANAVDPMNFI